jgi:predicted MFS family arabinose efflux permease
MALASRFARVQAALQPWYLAYGLAGLLGAALGGWAADAAGYPAALVVAAAGLAVALVLSVPLRHPA